jgi:hypothetical protein
MPGNEAESHYESLWKNQEEEKMQITMDEVCVRAHAFERKSVREYWLVLGVLALFIAKAAFYLYQFPSPMSRVGFTSGIAILLYIAVRWARNGPPKKLAALATPHPCVQFMRSELERKREAVLEIRWTLFLFLPAMLASWRAGTPVAIAKSLGIDAPWYLRFQQSPAPLILFALMLVIIWRGFGKEARRIAREIEKLPQD